MSCISLMKSVKTPDISSMDVDINPNTAFETDVGEPQQVQNCAIKTKYQLDETHQNQNIETQDNQNFEAQESHCVEPAVTHELDDTLQKNNDLPEGWKQIIHASGMPIYFNESMKVCSFGKPYFLGVNSLKNHEIPVANVPCLSYKSKLQATAAKENGSVIECPVTLSHEKYREYCKKLFKFKNIKFMRFSSWDKRREYIRMIKADRRRKDIPKLKDKSQLMSFPVQQPGKAIVNSKNNPSDPDNHEAQWTINLNGKSYVSILHEYIQRVLKTQPSYEFKELENARFPYLATVILDGIQYGIGIGSSKKLAKLDAARATLEVLLPSVKNQIQINRRHAMNERHGNNSSSEETIFDQLKIKDSRIPEFCSRAAESMPYDMLQICAKRNFGENININCDMETIQSALDSKTFYRCTMSIKEHSATVICKNKREGRQKGAQALLKVLHPHISYFGSLLRLYSHQNYGSSCEKKLDETNEPPKPRNGPNYEILRRLREEMSRLQTYEDHILSCKMHF